MQKFSFHYVHCTINSDRQVSASCHRQTASGYLDATVSKIKEMTNLRELCHSRLKLCIKLKGLETWPLVKGQEPRTLVWPAFCILNFKSIDP